MKKIAWNEPAQPAIRDDYFSSLIGPEMDADKAVEIVDRMQKRVGRLDKETVSRVSSVLLEMVKLANELSGMDNTLTKREALLVREEDQPQLYSGSHHSTAVFGGRKIRLCAQLKICPRVWLVERQNGRKGPGSIRLSRN